MHPGGTRPDCASTAHDDAPANRIRALNTMAAAIAGAEHLDDVFELVAEETRRAIGADSLSIGRYEPAGNLIRTLVAVGDLSENEERFPVDETWPLADLPRIAACLKAGRGYWGAVDDPGADAGEVSLLQQLDKESQIGVPITVGDQLWGELWAGSSPGSPRFGPGDVDLLEAVAGYVAIGVGRAELLARLHELAHSDSLTGLFNHREFHQALDRHIAGQESAFSVVVLDVDGFKQINDRHGHAEGDRVLRAIALALRSACRTEDTAFRVGGDEFALLLPGTSRGGAHEAVGRLRDLAARCGPVAVSAGIATWPQDGPTKDGLLLSADRELYAAKGGRYEEDHPHPDAHCAGCGRQWTPVAERTAA